MGRMTLIYSKKQDLQELCKKAEEVSFKMVEALGNEFQTYERELEELEQQIQVLEQELN